MPAPAESAPKVKIAHVLSTDVVGYSLLLITEQIRVMNQLTSIVKSTEQFCQVDAQGKLMSLPTGDGMSLVFFDDPQAPIECAIEIASALKSHPDIPLRMGIHSGPVNKVINVSDRSNVAGAGMDIAQRVMSCGDAGHILLSKRVAEDLAPFPRWHPHFHDLGECEVKHGRKVGLVNFCNGEVGNPELPKSCATQDSSAIGISTPASGFSGPKRALIAGAALLTIAVAVGFFFVSRSKTRPLWKDSGAAQATSHSIAVLPFENAGNDPNAEYLAEGISEALINSLTELQQLKVIARSTAFHYKGNDVDPRRVGRELQVTAVLTGKVRQVQDALSVQVDLVDASTGAQLWGKGYDRTISDVVTVKQAIAREVTENCSYDCPAKRSVGSLNAIPPTRRPTSFTCGAAISGISALPTRSDRRSSSSGRRSNAIQISLSATPGWPTLIYCFSSTSGLLPARPCRKLERPQTGHCRSMIR